MRTLISIMLLFGATASALAADPMTLGWRLSPEISLAGSSSYVRQQGTAKSKMAAAVTLQLELQREARHYRGGPFLVYSVSNGAESSQQLNLGMYYQYELPRWDTTTYVIADRSRGATHAWYYATRIRYRVSDRHKFGIEAIAPLDDASAPLLMAGYYGQLRSSWSVKLLAGTAYKGTTDLAVNFVVSRQVH